jgi:hypothetical protein
MLTIDNAAVPLFVSLTDLAGLVVPTGCLPKLRLEVERETVWALLGELASKRDTAPSHRTSGNHFLFSTPTRNDGQSVRAPHSRAAIHTLVVPEVMNFGQEPGCQVKLTT